MYLYFLTENFGEGLHYNAPNIYSSYLEHPFWFRVLRNTKGEQLK